MEPNETDVNVLGQNKILQNDAGALPNNSTLMVDNKSSEITANTEKKNSFGHGKFLQHNSSILIFNCCLKFGGNS